MHLPATLDRYAEVPKYLGSDVPTEGPNERWTEMWTDRYGSIDLVVFGRRSFEGHANFHVGVTREPSIPKCLFEYSR